MWRYLLPLGGLAILVVFFFVGPASPTIGDSFPADRQVRAVVLLAERRGAGTPGHERRLSWSYVRVECVGNMVRRLSRRTLRSTRDRTL